MSNPAEHATAATAALSTSYATFSFPAFPDSCHLGGVKLTIAGASTTGQVATAYLSTDSAGDEGISEKVPATLQYGETTGTDAWVVYDYDRLLMTGAGPVTLYLHVVLDTGSATGCVPTLTYRVVR